jgi:uncharacterized delta-60 repeat protein
MRTQMNFGCKTTLTLEGCACSVLSLSLALILVSCALVIDVEAAEGDLDPTFGIAGKVTTDFIGYNSAVDVAVQRDDKIIVVGNTGGFPASNFLVARYHSDGSLDTSFGDGGKVVTDFGGFEAATALALQQDGKIVVAGIACAASDEVLRGCDFAVARYNGDGSPDASFGNSGKVTTDVLSNHSGVASAVAVQRDGRIVVAGRANSSTSTDFALVRYNSDGSLDVHFGNAGKVTTDFRSADEVRAIALQRDGKIVAAGTTSSGADNDFALARYRTDGSLDPSFGDGGKVITDFFGDSSEAASDVAIQANGRIVVVGTVRINGTFGSDFLVARYRSDGTLDRSFGDGGKVTTEFGGFSVFSEGAAVVLQADGRLVVAGSAFGTDDAISVFALARYNKDGSLDTRFGDGGTVTTDFGDFAQASGVTLQRDGEIVVVGSTESADIDFALARYFSKKRKH